jgi:hypothetical protein
VSETGQQVTHIRGFRLKTEEDKESNIEFDATPTRDYFPHMSSTADKLAQEIKSPAAVEKLRLVDALLADLDRLDPEIDRIWAEEARKRWDAYKSGRLRTVSYEEVMSKHRDQ